MKIKTIKKVLDRKFDQWLESITDENVKRLVSKNSIITGGCVASMLLREPVNDFDVYFTDLETTEAVARYYVGVYGSDEISVDVADERVRIATKGGFRGATAGNMDHVNAGEGDVEDVYEQEQVKALEKEDGGFKPVFFSTNAITLTNKIQVVLRFYGNADQIHENYDFVHCTNYWTSLDGVLVLRQRALEAILSKELIYVGSKYPVCSIIRLRKFISRQWTVNAGQILKMLLQAGELDLTDPKVLEDQLTGVDSAYFCQLINQIKEKNDKEINASYLVEIINRLF